MNNNSPLIVLLLFALRIGIPLVLTLGLAYLYDTIAGRWEKQARAGGDRSQSQGSKVPALSASVQTECPIRARVECACQQWPSIPCWLALQLTEGHIPEECLNCQRFSSNAHKSELAGA